MRIFMPSPFDTLIIELHQSILKNPAYKPLTSLGRFVFSYILRLRVVYINYSFLDEPYQDPTRASLTGEISLEEMISMSDPVIKTSLDYFSLINELNQFGTFLKKEFGTSLPYYEEIYFFRNKVTEHWGDYVTYKFAKGAMGKGKKRATPCMLSKNILMKERKKAQHNLISEFSKYNIIIPSLDGFHAEHYANIIYPALKKIDPELKSQISTKKVKNLFQRVLCIVYLNLNFLCQFMILKIIVRN